MLLIKDDLLEIRRTETQTNGEEQIKQTDPNRHIYTTRDREREIERQRDRETERQKETDGQTDRVTVKPYNIVRLPT